jgi:septal ring factor EnvC (AmiA/AmiB activator)
MKLLTKLILLLALLSLIVIILYPWQKQSKPQVEQIKPVIENTEPKEQPKLSKEAEELKSSLDSLNNSKTKKEVFQKRKELKELSNKLLEDEAKAAQVLTELIESPEIGLQMRAVSMLGKAKKPWCNELLIKGTESNIWGLLRLI